MEENAVQKAVEVYRIEYEDENPVRTLNDYTNNVKGKKADIRMMNMILQMSLLCYTLFLMFQGGAGVYTGVFAVWAVIKSGGNCTVLSVFDGLLSDDYFDDSYFERKHAF